MEPTSTELTTHPGGLKSAPLCLGAIGAVIIDPDGAVAKSGSYPITPAKIGAPHRSREAINSVVAELNCLFFGGEGFNRDHRPERFLLHTGHLCRTSIENCGLDIPTGFQSRSKCSLASHPKSGTFLDCSLDISKNFVEMTFANEWSSLSGLIIWSTKSDFAGSAH